MCPEITKTEESVATPTAAAKPTAKKTVAKAKDPKAKKVAKKTATKAKKAASSGTHDGTAVGYEAKCKTDCRWNKTRVSFYKALRKIGGSGTAERIAKTSGDAVSVGNALNYGYHGVQPGLNKVEQHEDVKGFVFVLTAKGRSLDLDKVLEKVKK
jgi:hypothetical protein